MKKTWSITFKSGREENGNNCAAPVRPTATNGELNNS